MKVKQTINQLIEWGFISTTDRHKKLTPHYEIQPLAVHLQLGATNNFAADPR